MKKSKMKKVIKSLEKELEFKNECLKDSADELMGNCNHLHDYIKTLEKQLLQQDKAIERKDLEFQGLKAAYRDDLINAGI